MYMHDYHKQCFVDKCTNCVIIMGPCETSTFVRDCKDCILVLTCQQLRMRDCVNCEIMLYSHTDPVVEACSEIRFRNHEYAYPELLSQMNSAKLSVFNNQWTYVYDFTVDKQGGKNFHHLYDSNQEFVAERSIMDQAIAISSEKAGHQVELIDEIDPESFGNVEVGPKPRHVIPFTRGDHKSKTPAVPMFFTFFYPYVKEDVINQPAVMEAFERIQAQIVDGTNNYFQHTRQTPLKEEELEQLLAVVTQDEETREVFRSTLDEGTNMAMTIGWDFRIAKDFAMKDVIRVLQPLQAAL